MAEINVEKRKAPVWPWVALALLVVAAIVWWSGDDENETTNQQVVMEEGNNNPERMEAPQQTQSQPAEVQDYVTYIENNGNNIDVSHEYTHDALTRLADALEGVAQGKNADLANDNDMQKLREQADRLKQEPSSDEHADVISQAFTSAANILDNLQEEYFPEDDAQVEEVKNAAEAVDPNTTLTDQKDKVHNFFDKSAIALEGL
ncbi:MAG: hypothetical protein WD555_00440 [Fulvivirga sp.]